ncbi:MAG TPA: UDP-N-acetylmuramoyl-tripeptide--D-alanyl-D-alanine ligase [Verrucomicrobiae bacterium]|jgi:UDP-N-acetylmuramoyl-tripeptide--D-alanyl-D-alanine ligase|nr:UDP-N-acetylmuramoyl-tripeptide--D-alanyl-D-alanine ligase [Verrucomicrobiae bacterium]
MEPLTLENIAQTMEGELLNASTARPITRLSIDSRQVKPGDLFIALAGERFDGHAFLAEAARLGASAVVAERRKLPADFNACPVILVDNTRRALGRLGAAYRRAFDLSVVAVGGSNGKTTTKELIASVLRQKMATLWSEASFNNDVGVPLTLLRLERAHQAAVLEAGTNHPGELAPLLQMMSPRFGVVTNIGREHLEFFHDLVGVVREEGSIGECLPGDGVLFLNGDNPWSEILTRRTRSRVVLVGLDRSNDCVARDVGVDENGAAFTVDCRYRGLSGEYRIKLLGRHQVTNALLAFAVGAEMGLTRAEIQEGLLTCAPAKMRLQMSSPGGIRVLNDCYNANADSMLAALQTLRELPCAGRRVAVLGDMAEQGECSRAAHFEVGRRAASSRLDQLFAIGRRGCEIAAAARSSGFKSIVEIDEVDQAAEAVKEFARPGDVVLVKASRSMRLERITERLCASSVNGHP